jgi:hypothetical protein
MKFASVQVKGLRVCQDHPQAHKRFQINSITFHKMLPACLQKGLEASLAHYLWRILRSRTVVCAPTGMGVPWGSYGMCGIFTCISFYFGGLLTPIHLCVVRPLVSNLDYGPGMCCLLTSFYFCFVRSIRF